MFIPNRTKLISCFRLKFECDFQYTDFHDVDYHSDLKIRVEAMSSVDTRHPPPNPHNKETNKKKQ